MTLPGGALPVLLLAASALLGCASPEGSWSLAALEVNGNPQELESELGGVVTRTSATLEVDGQLSAHLQLVVGEFTEDWAGGGERADRRTWDFLLSGPGPDFPLACTPAGGELDCAGLYDDTDQWDLHFTPAEEPR
jgi:hypothetical protein